MLHSKDRICYRADRIHSIALHRIHPNPTQSRRRVTEGLEVLAQSIRRHGILQPLSVRSGPDGYELVAGERRWRAAKLAGLTRVPCVIVSAGDREADVMALAENLQRQELDYLEQAEAIARLIRVYELSQEQAGALLGRSQSAIANKLRLLHHSPAVQQALRDSGLSERHARALLRLSSEEDKLTAIAHMARQGLTVAAAEAYLDRFSSGVPVQDPADSLLALLQTQQAALEAQGICIQTLRQEEGNRTVVTIILPKKPEPR